MGRKRLAVAAAALAAGIGGTVVGDLCSCVTPAPPPADPNQALTANIWLDPAAADDTGTRSASLVSFSTAQANDNVVKHLKTACDLAQAGDIVGVKAGTFATVDSRFSGAIQGLDGDCATPGSPADDPDTRTNWTRFICDDGGTKQQCKFHPIGANISTHFFSNAHASFEGGFSFANAKLGNSGDTTRVSQNIAFLGDDVRIHFDAMELRGARNVRVDYHEAGPVTICATTSSSNPTNEKCRSDVTWEARYTGANNTNLGGFGQFPFIGNNSGGFTTINAKFSRGWWHDSQTKNDASWHGGCGIVLNNRVTGDADSAGADDANNIVFDRIVCERVQVQGIFLEGSNGVTVVNSWIGCSTDPLDNDAFVNWSECVASQASFVIKDGTASYTPTNILVRYNSFYGGIRMGNYGSYSNVRVIGNVAKTWITACEAGVTWDRNAWRDASVTCTDGTEVNGQGAPWTTGAFTNYSYPPSDAQVATAELNFHLSAGAKSFEDWISETGSDYALATDYDAASRSNPRDAGSDER